MASVPSHPILVAPLARGDAALAAADAICREVFAGTDSNTTSVSAELERPFAHAWVARIGSTGTPIGFAVAWLVADELHVLNVATAPAFRRLGAGRALMRGALGFARERAVRLVLLEVRRSNRAAIRLYRSLGFTIMGLRSRYYADDGEDALEMVLVLDPKTGHIVPGRDELRLEEV
jgi:ribosomal-protein-alanine N-acetyltransferase